MLYELIVILSFSWVSDCQKLITRELVQHNDTYLNDILFAIPYGIHLANVIEEVERTDQENLNRCALSIAVARYESTFNVKAKNKTCLGMYQITASTVKDIIKDTSFLTKTIKDSILTPMAGTCIFNLLMNKWEQQKGSLYKALIRYNVSHKVTNKIIKYYQRLISS